MIHTVCEHCGKHVQVDEHFAGKRAKCKCGNSFLIPTPHTQPAESIVSMTKQNGAIVPSRSDPSPRSFLPAHAATHQTPKDTATKNSAYHEQRAFEASSVPPETMKQSGLPPAEVPFAPDVLTAFEKSVIIGGVFAGLLIAATLMYVFVIRDHWEGTHRQTLLAIKANAETSAKAGKLEESQSTYRELFQILGDRNIRDPDLQQQLTDAKQDSGRVDLAIETGKKAAQELERKQQAEIAARDLAKREADQNQQEQDRMANEREVARKAKEQQSLQAEAAVLAKKQAARSSFLTTAYPLVKKAQNIRDRVQSGLDDNTFKQKVGELADAYSDLPPVPDGDIECAIFVGNAKNVVDIYNTALDAWNTSNSGHANDEVVEWIEAEKVRGDCFVNGKNFVESLITKWNILNPK